MMKPILVAAAAIAGPADAQSVVQPSYVSGTVTNVTATREGVMIMTSDNRYPGNCVSPPIPWMLIRQADTAMISVFLTNFTSGRRNFTIYVDQTSGGFCSINQIDPQE